MVKRFEKYFDAWYVYFTAEPPQFNKKRLWGFEKFVFFNYVNYSRENVRLIARSPFPFL